MNANIYRARISLEGLSVGDAFGDQYFVHPETIDEIIESRELFKPLWGYTDDTMMALSIVECLNKYKKIDQEYLGISFARHYDRSRAYGPAMHRLLDRIRAGVYWEVAARSQFEGQGSYGNGAAMRVAPLGAYYADDLDKVIEQATLSAMVTHSHPEGIAGAIAVAVAAAWASRCEFFSCAEFIDTIIPSVPPNTEVATKLRYARDLDAGSSVKLAVTALGNGTKVSAQDTVPFAIWCAGQMLDFEESMWLTVSGLGDRDTTCAIVGGIVILREKSSEIPAKWLDYREPLPEWHLEDL